MTPETFTGIPESLVGVNLDARAAATAAPVRSGCPDTGAAEITLPFSSITICTFTWPDACALRAIAGYGGCTKRTAFPFNTPPEIGAFGGVGFGGGGGGASATSTFEGAEMILPVPE